MITVGYDLVEWSPALWNPRKDKEIIHIDSTPAETDDHYLPAIEVVGEIGDALRGLVDLCREHPRSWWSGPDRRHREGEAIAELRSYAGDDSFPMKPQRIMYSWSFI